MASNNKHEENMDTVSLLSPRSMCGARHYSTRQIVDQALAIIMQTDDEVAEPTRTTSSRTNTAQGGDKDKDETKPSQWAQNFDFDRPNLILSLKDAVSFDSSSDRFGGPVSDRSIHIDRSLIIISPCFSYGTVSFRRFPDASSYKHTFVEFVCLSIPNLTRLQGSLLFTSLCYKNYKRAIWTVGLCRTTCQVSDQRSHDTQVSAGMHTP